MRAKRARDAATRLALVALAGIVPFAPAPARARESTAAASGGALRIVADPPRLLLGRDATSELRVSVAPDVEDVALYTSAGHTEDLRRLPDGTWAARFRAPDDRVPQVAILAAIARSPRGSEDGWLALPLAGQGEAHLHAEPGSLVSLKVGDRVFGPRRTDHDGLASIPVIVPPGIREAHQGFKPIDLNVPEMPLLLTILDRSTVLADREEQIRVLAFVVAPHGAARRGDVPSFEPTRGTVSVSEREPGAYQATWTLPPGRAGEERLAVRLSAAPASRTVLRLEAAPGPAAAVAVSFDRRALVAGSSEAVGVTARALDAAGNGVPAALELTTDFGVLEGVRERAPGVLEARLHAAPGFQGRREARVTGTVPGMRISGGRALPLRPAEPEVATFQAGEGVLRADGSREAVLRVEIADRHGNPVEAVPAVTAERGRIAGVAAAAPGIYEVRYVAPAVDGPTPERIVARIAGARAEARRVLVPDRRRLSATAAGGIVAEGGGRGSWASLSLGAEGALDLAFALRVGLEPRWRVEAAGLADGDAQRGAVLAGLGLRRGLPRRLQARVGALGGAFLGGGAAPALRIAIEIGLARRGIAPYLEAGFLAAFGGDPGGFAAGTLSVGARIGAE